MELGALILNKLAAPGLHSFWHALLVVVRLKNNHVDELLGVLLCFLLTTVPNGI